MLGVGERDEEVVQTMKGVSCKDPSTCMLIFNEGFNKGYRNSVCNVF